MQPWAGGGCSQPHSLTFSEALANLEPVELKARAARGPSWAGMVQAVFCGAQGNVRAKGHVVLGLCEDRVFLSHTLPRPADMDSQDHPVLMVSLQHPQQFISALP